MVRTRVLIRLIRILIRMKIIVCIIMIVRHSSRKWLIDVRESLILKVIIIVIIYLRETRLRNISVLKWHWLRIWLPWFIIWNIELILLWGHISTVPTAVSQAVFHGPAACMLYQRPFWVYSSSSLSNILVDIMLIYFQNSIIKSWIILTQYLGKGCKYSFLHCRNRWINGQ